jgi:hypothetical protein
MWLHERNHVRFLPRRVFGIPTPKEGVGTMSERVTEPHRRSQAGLMDEQSDANAPPVPTISPRQQQALQVLLRGGTDIEAAQAAHVARETVCRWRRGHADFIAALNMEREVLNEGFRDAVRALLPEALRALQDGLQSPDMRIRVRVAETLIRALSKLGDPGETHPGVIRAEWRTVGEVIALSQYFGMP